MKRIAIPLSGDAAKRFWPKVRILENGCWEWIGAVSAKGYGRFYSHTESGKIKVVFAHVWSYEQTIGPVPEGKELDHTCRLKRCVNPLHAEPVTHKENILRGESFAAKKKRQTHCKRGHEFTPENTLRDQNGNRRCKACIRAIQKQWASRKKGSQ